MDTAFDVAVVGAGPAGSMAAWGLARAGMSVALLDRATFPRDKVCGDALLPDAVQALEEASLLETVRKEALAVGGAVFRSPGGHMLRVGGDFLTIRRERLDAMLVEAARAAGARFFPGVAVTGPLEDKGEVRGVVGTARAEGAPAEARVRSRAIVLACGSHPRALEPFGVLTRPIHSAIALRGYFPRDPFPGLSVDGPALFISYDRTLLPGYGWAFPMPDGRHLAGRRPSAVRHRPPRR
jgi:flavin-dependent dehydrogenase